MTIGEKKRTTVYSYFYDSALLETTSISITIRSQEVSAVTLDRSQFMEPQSQFIGAELIICLCQRWSNVRIHLTERRRISLFAY
jgi:hypothetical protein